MESLAEYIVGIPAPVVVRPEAERPEPVQPDSGVDFDLLRAEDAAKVVGVHPATVYRWLRAGELRGFRIGRVVRIRRCDLAEFIRANLSAQL